MYFKQMPKIKYPWEDKNGKFHGAVVPDIFRRVQLDKFFKNRTLLIEIFLDDKDTPESVAHDYYGSVNYHWIVLLSNDIIDVNREWPLSTEALGNYVKDKYGADNSSDVHHYVDSTHEELIVDWDAAKLASGTIKAITNYNYESERNDKKRQIFLLNKRYVKDLVSQYKKLVK
tara:strand:+ start:249 stop:767 length:519 start_codon:yes stop_codon:yes gene_type:complete